MKTTIEGNEMLSSIAKDKGFSTYATPYGKGCVNFTQRTIELNPIINDERNFRLSHELGHIYLYKIVKWIRYLNELSAWIIGFLICKKNNIDTNEFWGVAKKCLDTYRK